MMHNNEQTAVASSSQTSILHDHEGAWSSRLGVLQRGLVKRIYELISSKRTSDHIGALIENWLQGYEQVHGQLERKREVNRQALVREYGVANVDLPVFLIASEMVFSLEAMFRAYAALCATLGQVNNTATKNPDAPLESFTALLTRIVNGDAFRQFRIKNFRGPPVLRALLEELTGDDLVQLHEFYTALDRSLDPASVEAISDPFSKSYHALYPKQVRHALGAYYTPRWLAEYVVDHVTKSAPQLESILDKRFLDPTCGSGVFLAAVVRAHLQQSDKSTSLSGLLSNLVGFDINPVAVLAAKANCVLAAAHLLAGGAQMPRTSVRLPIYLCDSIHCPEVTPSATVAFSIGALHFELPRAVISFNRWDELVDLIEVCLSQSLTATRFLQQAEALFSDTHPRDEMRLAMEQMYSTVGKQDNQYLRSSTCDRLRDVFAPLTTPPFDFVVGNPPWVNWEYLPPAYRDQIKHLWPTLGLFALNGRDMANSKEDISVLCTYVAAERFLADGGLMGLLVPQSLFKSSLNAQGFRRFRIGQSGAALMVHQVDDMTDVNPFEGVNNRTAVVFIQKGQETKYPLPYRIWTLSSHPGRPKDDIDLQHAMSKLRIVTKRATPIVPSRPNSHWITGSDAALRVLPKLAGKCPYRGRTGMFTGGANGVFYLSVLQEHHDGTLTVRNVTERAKRLVPSVEARMEDTFVFPMLRGRDVSRWKSRVELSTLCPHTAETRMQAVLPAIMEQQAPLTFQYLKQFQPILLERRGFASWDRAYLESAFYACQRIGTYTFAPYKVIWRYICTSFQCAVVEPGKWGPKTKPIIPHEKLMLIGFTEPDEAYYVCGILSSAPVRFYVESHMVNTQIAPHVIETIGLPRYSPTNADHRAISSLCKAGHEFVAANPAGSISPYMEELDGLAARVFGLEDAELSALQEDLSWLESEETPGDDDA